MKIVDDPNFRSNPDPKNILDQPLWTMYLSDNERKLILRVREAAQTGQQLIVDTDSMTWRAVGKLENIRNH